MAPPYSKLMSQLTTGSGSIAQAAGDGGNGSTSAGGGGTSGGSSQSQSSSHSKGGKGGNSKSRGNNNNNKAGTVRPRLRRQEEELLRQVQAARRVEVPATAAAGDNHSNNNHNNSDHGPSQPSEEQAQAMMAVSAVAMNPRIMNLQRQIAREAALMATMTSAAQQQGGHQMQQQPRQHPGQPQQMQMMPQMMMPTHGNGISYNAIGMNNMGGLLHHHYACHNAPSSSNRHGSASSSVSSSSNLSSNGGSSVGTADGSKKKSGKRRKSSRGDARLERDGIRPPFFHGKKLRSGVWLQAEIEYAMEIIQDFRRGNLPDCPNGATLRQYLAKKLHCNPMRLSKKLSKAMGNTPDSSLGGGNAGSNGPGYAHRAATSAAPNQRRVALERAFHEATLDRKAVLASSAANSVCSSKAPTPPPASVAAATVAKDKNKPVNVPPLGVLPVGGQPQVLQGLATVPVSNPFAMPMYQSGQQQQPQPMMSTNALEGALLLQNQASMQAQMASQMRQIQELQESLTEAKAELEKKERTAKHQAELHQSFLRAMQSKVSSSGSSGSQQPSDKPNGGKETDKATEKGRSNSTADYTELLAGFEEVAAAPAAASGGATDLDAAQIPLWSNVDTALSLGMPETPTLTSRSFDDFHRFLGQGIPSMPNLARGDQSTAPSNGPRPIAVAALNGPATEALHGQRGNPAFATGDISFNANSSDDYSMLAQQSVLAAMQHSAYAAPLETNAAAGIAATGTKRNVGTVSGTNSTSSSSSEPASKRVRIVPSTQRSTASSSSNSFNNNDSDMRVTLVSGTESESIFDSSSRGVTSSSGSGSDNDNSNDGTTSNDGSDDAGIESFGEPKNATAKNGLATNATEKEAAMEVSGSSQ